jgi:hypothetical protein
LAATTCQATVMMIPNPVAQIQKPDSLPFFPSFDFQIQFHASAVARLKLSIRRFLLLHIPFKVLKSNPEILLLTFYLSLDSIKFRYQFPKKQYFVNLFINKISTFYLSYSQTYQHYE